MMMGVYDAAAICKAIAVDFSFSIDFRQHCHFCKEL